MATLQKLLWSEEYSDFADEVVLVESRFVLERKHGQCLCMVHAGLTETVFLIAEESVETNADHLRTVVVATDAPSNVEYLHLAHLFPLQNTKLSTRRHQEHRGEHVLRLRLSTGKTWYLELADGRHREDRWREWLSWIHDLDERRHERLHPPSTEAISAPQTRGDLKLLTVDSQGSAAALAAAKHRKRRESRAYHWVGHFQGALSRDHDGQMSAEDHDTPDMGLPGDISEPPNHHRRRQHSSNTMIMKHGHSTKSSKSAAVIDPTASLVWQHPGNHNSFPVRKVSFSSTDTFSSLADIESVGSLVGHADVDWRHPLSEEINRKLLLCVGDLFQKFNIEAHGHGHVGRRRPMASLTAVDQLRDSDITTSHRKRRGLPPIPGKENLQHRCSLPDVLEGEAGFLDEMDRAANAAHRESLVYMDLVNDDDTKTPHVIGGHVMMLSPEQTGLQEEIARAREMSAELVFMNAEGRVCSKQFGTVNGGRGALGEKTPQRQRRKSVGESLKERLHLGSHGNHKNPPGMQHDTDNFKHLSTRILHSIRKRKRSRREGESSSARPQQIASLREIDPEILALELTLVDSLLFVRVREAELVDCLWLKGDKHVRAPHTTRLIEFFERVVGLVSTEILRPSTAKERAATVASFVQVAETCRKLRNFHSLKAVLSGMKVLPVYRLKDTWRIFEEEFPAEFGAWSELVFLMADDGRSDLYKMAVKKSLESPPCLPFFGAFLLSIVDLYSAVDRAGMRRQSSRRRGQWSSSSSSCCYSSSTDWSESLVHMHKVHYATDDANTGISISPSPVQPKPMPQAGFFTAFATAWHTLHHKQVRPNSSDYGDSETPGPRGMTDARKAHIRRLIIAYAKRCARDQGMTWRAAGAATAADLLGAAFFAGVDSPIDWGSLFAKVQPAGMPTPSQEEAEEKEEKRNAEYRLYETLFTYQRAAVQYRHTSNKAARDYLLHASYNTDQRNYRLSRSREPPSD